MTHDARRRAGILLALGIGGAASLATLGAPAFSHDRADPARMLERLEARLEARGFTNVARETGGSRDYVVADGPDGAIRIPLPTAEERAERRRGWSRHHRGGAGAAD